MQHGLGTEVALRHLAHPFGQDQQWPRQLIAQQHRQEHSAKHREKQAQRQGADVHAPQATARQGALLVFAVGFLHGDGVVHEHRRQGHDGLEIARLCHQAHAGVGHQHQGGNAHIAQGLRAGDIGQFVQTLELPYRTLLTYGAQLLGGGALLVKPIARLAHTRDQLTRSVPQQQIAGSELVPNALQHQARSGIGSLRQLRTEAARPRRRLADLHLQRGTGQTDPCGQRTLDLDVEPAFDGTRDKLVRHVIDQQARHQPHQGKDGRQLDQQAATETPPPQAQQQTHSYPQQHGQQEQRHHHVDAKQPPVVALVQDPVVGGEGQEKKEHQGDGRHDGRPHPYGPAHRPRRA